MTRWMWTMVLAGAAAGMIGCGGSSPNTRQPVDSINDSDTGIQSKDVDAATEKMVNSLLSQSSLNASATQWTVVLDRKGFRNLTLDQSYSYQVFYTLLQSKLSNLSKGRITLIQDKADFHAEQNRELDTPPDAMGQGGGGGSNPAGIQPQYALLITISQMPNRTTDYFVINAELDSLTSRVMPWSSPAYEFRSAR